MKHYLMGVAMLLVLSLALFLVETHRTWGLIVFMLALIFYALFANPWKHAQRTAFAREVEARSTLNKRKKKKTPKKSKK
ncbi:MAG: hypothetical protein FJY86_01085 [Candidatus Diapherotrites archaeon]|uniref:Uncharacterized protein n=1 Tax=Candidatus Iainarchaeum sp. TaxID=3101447 RepID=A0A8T4C686_9ARCH|nr:hypothetical protein [Candidatus Diapherotrites archaeon]